MVTFRVDENKLQGIYDYVVCSLTYVLIFCLSYFIYFAGGVPNFFAAMPQIENIQVTDNSLTGKLNIVKSYFQNFFKT